MRRPSKTAAGWHTQTHDRRAHHHDSSSRRFFFLVLFTALLFLVWAGCVPFGKNDPRNRRERGTWYPIIHSCAAPFVRQSGDTRRWLIFVRRFSVRLLFFHRISASRHSDKHPRQQAVSSLCSRLPCVSYGAGSTPDSNSSSHELVSRGN